MSEEHTEKNHTNFRLPASLVTKGDISRLLAEVEQVDNEFIEAHARGKVGADGTIHPALSGNLSDFLAANEFVIEDGDTRGMLVRELRRLKEILPVIHITFSVSADGESLQKIVTWFRDSVHPQAVLDVGLQPALVAGVHLRTTNHVHDFSVRAVLDEHRDILTKELEALRVGQ